MKTPEATSTNIKEAQILTNKNLARFELAMDHLADKVDKTSHKIQHYRDLASVPQRLYRKVLANVSRLMTPLKNKPTPYVVSALGIIALYSIYKAANSSKYGSENYRSVKLGSKSTSRSSLSKRLLLS